MGGYSAAMAANRKLEHLANVKMFSSLNKKELGLIERASDVVNVKAGTEIVTEGKMGHEFYLILEGEASVRRGGRKIATLGPGNYFGEMALLDRGPRSATIVAESNMELAIIGQREFMAVLDQVPAVAHKMLVSMAARLREADTRVVSH
jgi:CRP/FNR family cyclic AMP-dependent transcriptional regulator